jgi:CxxC motif-containing protein (DUF1111 family)
MSTYSRSYLLRGLLFGLVLLVPTVPAEGRVFQNKEKQHTGEDLFKKVWKPNKAEATDLGDGLGPMFNGISCVACHNQGGVGGGGDNIANVQILTVLPRQDSRRNFRLDPVALEMLFEQAVKLHPDFKLQNSVILHRSSVLNEAYGNWLKDVFEFKSVAKTSGFLSNVKLEEERGRLLTETPIHRVKKGSAKDRYTIQVSRRNTPSLFGVGIIDKISDQDILTLESAQKETDGPVKGIASISDNGKVGKFGWRGEQSSVAKFTSQACAIELGLSNADHPQARMPLSKSRHSQQPSHDISKSEIKELVEFVNSLDPIAARPPKTNHESQSLREGQEQFNSIGCAECHVQTVGIAQNVFSDFLLHDMGPELADASHSIMKKVKSPPSGNSRHEFEIKNPQRWQTPPLWGSALSAPYMHDGRSDSFHDAILVHGGEAATSVDKYKNLNPFDRKLVLEFLQSLGDDSTGGNEELSPEVHGWSIPPKRSRRGRLVRKQP